MRVSAKCYTSTDDTISKWMSSVVGYLNCYSCSLSSGTSLLSLLIFSSPNTFKFPRQKCSFVRLDISRSIHHAMRFAKYFSERACVLFFLPACKYYLVLANQKRTGISTMALSLSVGRTENWPHWCYSLSMGLILLCEDYHTRNRARVSYNSVTR